MCLKLFFIYEAQNTNFNQKRPTNYCSQMENPQIFEYIAYQIIASLFTLTSMDFCCLYDNFYCKYTPILKQYKFINTSLRTISLLIGCKYIH